MLRRGPSNEIFTARAKISHVECTPFWDKVDFRTPLTDVSFCLKQCGLFP